MIWSSLNLLFFMSVILLGRRTSLVYLGMAGGEQVRMYWMWMYNHERPNMALGGMTPKQRLAMAA